MGKQNLINSFVILAVAAVAFSACQKVEMTVQTASDKEEIFTPTGSCAKLVSAELTETKSLADVLDLVLQETGDSTFKTVFSSSIFGVSIANFEIATYKIKYKTVVRNETGYHNDAILTGYASFIVDKTGNYLKDRTLESVSLMNTVFNTSAKDVTIFFDIFKVRTIYNALVVCPCYQGGDLSDGYVPAPSEFLIKGKQAIDCELAALEFVGSLDNVKMADDYYTENYGVSNGGGPALAIPYLLQNDDVYKAYTDKINLSSSFIGEGNCSNAKIFPNYLLTNDESEEEAKDDQQSTEFTLDYETIANLDMTLLAPVAYITTVAGTYMTWKDKYFEGIELSDYFEEEAMPYVEIFTSNVGGILMQAATGKLPKIEKLVNQKLLVKAEDGTYSFNREEGSIINNLYDAFKENDVIASCWTPVTDVLIAHSTGDEFIYYKDNLKMWADLSNFGRNRNVHMETALELNHFESLTYFMLKDILLRKHPID